MKKYFTHFTVFCSLLFGSFLSVEAQQLSDDQLKVFQTSDLSKYNFDIEKKSKSLVKSQDLLEKDVAFKVYADALLRISSMINAGDFYINDEITSYLEGMIQKIDPDNNPESGIYRVLLSRSSIPNAFCTVDGTVIVNIGLIGLMENESQLAGVLAHEISHFKKKPFSQTGKSINRRQQIGKKSIFILVFKYEVFERF